MTPLARAVLAGDFDRAKQIAETDARAKSASRSRRKERAPRAAGKTQAQRREERNARAAKLRAAVMERAGAVCEWCHRPGFVLDWAHILDGGLRRYREAVDTTAALCADCHRRGWHKNKLDVLRAAKEWALRLGFREALHEIGRRLAKAESRHEVKP